MRYFISLTLFLAIATLEILSGGAFYEVFRFPAYLLLLPAIVGGIFILSKLRNDFSLSCIALATALFLDVALRVLGHQGTSGSLLGLAAAGFATYLLFATVLNRSRYRVIFLGALLLLAMGEVLVGVIQSTGNGNFRVLPWIADALKAVRENRFLDRSHGTYLNPNNYAVMLSAMGTYAMVFVFWGKLKAWMKLLCLYFCLVCFAGVVISLSRGAILASGVGLLMFFILSFAVTFQIARFRRLMMVILLALLVGGVSAGGYLIHESSFHAKSRLEYIAGTDIRPELWGAAVRQFESAPFLGRGPESYKYLSRFYINRWIGSHGADPFYAHNEYLQCLAEYGLVGFALLVAILLLHLTNGVREMAARIQRAKELDESPQSNSFAILIGSLCALMIWMTHAMFDSIQHVPANVLLVAATLGMLTTNSRKRQSDWENPGQSSVRAKLATLCTGVLLAACATALAVYCYRNGPSEYHVLVAENAIIRKNVPLALEEAQAALRLQPENGRYNYFYGEALILAGDQEAPVEVRRDYYESAQQALLTAVIARPEEYRYWVRLAWAYVLTRDFSNAQRCYLKAIQLNPALGAIVQEYARHFDFQDKHFEAYRHAYVGNVLPGTGYDYELLREFTRRYEEQKKQQQKSDTQP